MVKHRVDAESGPKSFSTNSGPGLMFKKKNLKKNDSHRRRERGEGRSAAGAPTQNINMV